MSDGINDSHVRPDKEYLPGVKRFRIRQGDNFESMVLEQEASQCVAILLDACKEVTEICEEGDTGASFERVVSAMRKCSKVMAYFV